MAYATQQAIQFAAGSNGATGDRFLSLFDWNGDGVADAEVIAEAQARADGWIDGFLRDRFATPIQTPSDTLIRLSADECVWWAMSAKGMTAMDPEGAKKREEREAYLKDLASGKKQLDEPNPQQSSRVVAATVSNDGDISRCGLKGSFW